VLRSLAAQATAPGATLHVVPCRVWNGGLEAPPLRSPWPYGTHHFSRRSRRRNL